MKLLVAAALSVIAAASFTQTISPGMWHDDTAYTLSGKPLPNGDAPPLTMADAQNIRKTMEYRMKRYHIDCTITN